MHYCYLHGFASSPRSVKAVYLRDRFRSVGLELQVPDLNQDDFRHLTLSRQIMQVESTLPSAPVTLLGSSFGGLTAAWVAQRCPQVERLVLLAPAFNFLAHWLPQWGEAECQHWQQRTYRLVYHYGEQRSLPLDYQFITDLEQYLEAQLVRSLPTLILHGHQDETIPIQASRNYAAQRPWVRLLELPSDHALNNVRSQLWQAIQNFCQISNS